MQLCHNRSEKDSHCLLTTIDIDMPLDYAEIIWKKSFFQTDYLMLTD